MAAPEAELFYVACLLHDHGIAEVVAGEDFTLRSADRYRSTSSNRSRSSSVLYR